MSERLWFYVQNNAQMGPVPESQLVGFFRSGALGPQTMVWSDGMAQWIPAGQIASLNPNPAAPQQPAAQPPAPAQPAAAQPATATAQAAGALSPSELVLLHGEKFASKAGMLGAGNFDLLHTAGQVSLQDLGKVMWGTAFLVLQQRGAIRLAMQSRKALLRTVQVLVAEPTGNWADVPQTSIEGAIQTVLSQQGPKDVDEIVYILLQSDSSNPWSDLVQFGVKGLEQRRLVWVEEKKAFLGKTYTRHATPEVIAMAQAQDPTWIRQLLGATPPDFWQTVTGAIGKAVSRRTESSSDGPDFA